MPFGLNTWNKRTRMVIPRPLSKLWYCGKTVFIYFWCCYLGNAFDFVYKHICLHICMHVCICIHAYIYIYIYIYIYMYSCLYIDFIVLICVCILSSFHPHNHLFAKNSKLMFLFANCATMNTVYLILLWSGLDLIFLVIILLLYLKWQTPFSSIQCQLTLIIHSAAN